MSFARCSAQLSPAGPAPTISTSASSCSLCTFILFLSYQTPRARDGRQAPNDKVDMARSRGRDREGTTGGHDFTGCGKIVHLSFARLPNYCAGVRRTLLQCGASLPLSLLLCLHRTAGISFLIRTKL